MRHRLLEVPAKFESTDVWGCEMKEGMGAAQFVSNGEG